MRAKICTLLASGRSDKEICCELSLKHETLRYYMRSLFRETGSRSRTDIALWYIFFGKDSPIAPRRKRSDHSETN